MKTKERYFVDIPKKRIPVFPKKCVVCGEITDRQLPVTGNPEISYFGGWKWLAGRSVRVKVYGHKRCIEGLNSNKSDRHALAYIVLSLMIPCLFLELNPFIYLPIIFGIFFAIIIYDTKRPVPFEVTKVVDSLQFEFQNKELASEFAKINNTTYY